MRLFRKPMLLAAMLAIGVAGAHRALAVDKEQVIKHRAALMKDQSKDLSAIKDFVEGKGDLPKATEAANSLPGDIHKIPDAFPPGTEGPSPDGKYAPKAEVWSDWKGFLAARDTAEEKAKALLTAVKSGDKAAIQAAFADAGKNGCGACHQKFREEIKK